MIGRTNISMKWTNVAYHVDWDYAQKPSLWIDALIAAEFASPILKEYQPDLTFWRFHRRARPDHAGHIFRVSIYAPKGISKIIRAKLKKAAKPLLKAGLLTAINYERKKEVQDERWDTEIREAWPAFMQGVSEFWLSLILHYVSDKRGKGKLLELTGVYCGAEDQLCTLWTEELSHPLLHHLNALFGGYPMEAKVILPMRF